jgi:Skp family chaperone for outer membrane proteins
MNFFRLVLLTVALLASTIAFSVRPPAPTDKVSANSLLGAHEYDVHVHAGNDPAAAPSLPVAAVPICMGLPTQASLDTSNTTMTQKTSNFDAVTAALSGAMATALSGAASAAMSGLLCATFLFGADVAPVHAVSTAQSLQNIEASLVEVTKELKQLSAKVDRNQQELSAKLDRNQQELSASQLALSAKLDRNQQELDRNQQELILKIGQVDRNQQELILKIGQVDYKYIWIPIIVSIANIFSRLVESNKPSKPTENYQYLFWGDQNKTAELSAFVGMPKGTLGPAFNHTGKDETDDKLT